MKNKNILITGSSRGIGRATAIKFGELGARVLIHYNSNRAAAEETVADTLKAGAAAAASLPFDLRNSENAGKLVNETVETFGTPDVLVHNAGLWLPPPIACFDPRILRDEIEANLVSTFFLIKEFVKHQSRGAIVLISSTAGQRGEAGYSGYSATKAGIIGITKSLAAELAPGIRVNSVAPGWVDTDMVTDALHGGNEEAILGAIPLKRVATAEDVADSVIFLASDASRHITGEILNINGGSVLCG